MPEVNNTGAVVPAQPHVLESVPDMARGKDESILMYGMRLAGYDEQARQEVNTTVSQIHPYSPKPLDLDKAAPAVKQLSSEGDMTPKGLKQLAIDEGYSPKVYKDTKKIDTIGVGFNLEEPANHDVFKQVVGFSVDEARAGRAITRQQADELLAVTSATAEREAHKLVPRFDSLPDEAQDAIVNFVFNLGFSKASQFKNTLKAINSGDGKAAAEGIRNSAYYKQVGKRGERVAKALELIGG